MEIQTAGNSPKIKKKKMNVFQNSVGYQKGNN